MGQKFSSISNEHRCFIEQQKIFFVATAAPRGRVNVSPKGMATLRVLGSNDVAYLDCTGSGSETRAHLVASEDRRLTMMFCAFEGKPLILRLYGQAQSLMRGTSEYGEMLRYFEEIPGARQIVRLTVELVQASCGMGVPLFEYKEDRQNLVRHWVRQGAEKIRNYWSLKNMSSIDGMPTKFRPDTMALPPWQN